MRSKKIFGGVIALTILAVLVFAFLDATSAEINYPNGSRWSTDVSFPVSRLSRSSIDQALDSSASAAKGTVYLLKADPKYPGNGLTLYEFPTSSAGRQAHKYEQPLHFLLPGRHGTIRSGSLLGSLSRAGTYYFTDENTCRIFTHRIHRAGASVLNVCRSNDQHVWVLSPAQGVNDFLAVLAFFILSAALVWSWGGSLAQSQRIRLLNGVPAYEIALQDAVSFTLLYFPIAISVLVLGAITGLIMGGTSAGTRFFLSQGSGTSLILGLILIAFTFLSSLVLHPRVTQIVERKNNTLLAR